MGLVEGWPVHVVGEGVWLRLASGLELLDEDAEVTIYC